MKGDREIVTAAVSQSGMALQWASHEIKDDFEVVMSAVEENWQALVRAWVARASHAPRPLVCKDIRTETLVSTVISILRSFPILLPNAWKIWTGAFHRKLGEIGPGELVLLVAFSRPIEAFSRGGVWEDLAGASQRKCASWRSPLRELDAQIASSFFKSSLQVLAGS